MGGSALISIPFDPEIHLGPLSLAWHGIFTAVGIFLGVTISIRLLRGRVSEDAAYSVAFWGVVGGIIGARLVHVADRWDYYSQNLLMIPAVWSGGIAVWGAAVGGVLGGLIVALRRIDVPIGGAADAAAAGIGLGFGVGRLGDIINGEHHAVTCDGGPGVCVEFTDPNTLGQSPSFPAGDFRHADGPVHLVVLYDMLWDLAGVALVLLLRRTALGRAPEGRIFWIWAFWYGLGRFTLGFLRIGDPYPIDHLRQDQLFAIGAMVLALPVLALIQSGVAARTFAFLRRGSPA